jgi:cell division protein FtsI (penicillin-binding protein 3)
MRSARLIFVLAGLLLLGGAGRLTFLEYSQGAQLRQQARIQSTAYMSVPAQRGEILDARGRVLAGSKRTPAIYADPSNIDDAPLAAYSIAPILNLDPAQLNQTLVERSERGFVWIKRGVTDAELSAFSLIRRQRRLDAFVVQQEPERVYPLERTAAQVIGFVGAEHHGMAGIEQAFDSHLLGRDGKREIMVDANRRRIQATPVVYEPPQDGATVVLTIDAHIQQCAEGHIREAVETFKAKWGTAVVLDSRTGEVLAMAVYPGFDPADPFPARLDEKGREAQQENIRNRAVSDAYEPGSIFKPFIAGPAFDEGLTTLGEIFDINGPTRSFGGRIIHDTHAYGALALWEVISKSSNIGMGVLGERLGNDRLHRYVRSMGFGDPTGIGLPGEHDGLVQDFSRWTNYSTQSIAIGQEIGVTPLQVVSAFSVFCNDGVLNRPRIVRGVISATGETIFDWSRPVPVRRVMSSRATAEFREQALAQVVVSGTGKTAHISDYQVFGKTGTAQIARENGRGYQPGAYVGSFVCGAPLRDPRVAVVVSICRPSGGRYYGGTVAAPAAGKIIADALAYMRVPPEPLLEQAVGPSADD